MADPSSFRPKPGTVPTGPGVYRFLDAHGRVIYVGKAKNLRNRLNNYFQPLPTLHPRTRAMVQTAAGLEWTTVATEVEALTLEYTWIKQFEPRFNVKYRDDKSYPYLAITISQTFPRAQVMRGAKRKGVKYFGPFGHAWAIRETLDLMTRVFPVRTCSDTVFQRYQAQGRPCLLSYIGKCSAPCVGKITNDQYRQIVEDFINFLSGQTSQFLATVRQAMNQAAAEQDFEKAAKLRDDAAALAKVAERNAVVLPENTNADLFALAGDELEAAIQVFHIRGGRVTGQRGWIVEKVEDIGDQRLLTHLLQTVYASAQPDEVPRQILLPNTPQDLDQLTQWLEKQRGGPVTISQPKRGDKAKLAATVQQNAEQALALHRARRAGDLTTRSQAIKELAEALDLDQAPLRIECYDISHTGGTNQVGSMVVFEDGLPRKSEYRHFTVRGPSGQGARDDTAAMEEVLTRRFTHTFNATPDAESPVSQAPSVEDVPQLEAPSQPGALANESQAHGEVIDNLKGRHRAFAYPPNLVVVDGGAPQVAAAQRAIDQTGAKDVAVVGLAKRLEEVYQPGDQFPVVLPRGGQALYLLQRVRDEAHRFAITAHRAKRSKAMTRSALSKIAGLGPARQKALLKHFGSLAQIRAASVAELAAAPGVGPKLANLISAQLHGKMEQ